MYAVVMEAYVNGISTRSVDNLVAALGVDTGISKSEVSRICAALDERVAAFRDRTLGHTDFPYVYLDYVHVRDDALGQVVSRAVVTATGITAEGGRSILRVDIGDSEDTTFTEECWGTLGGDERCGYHFGYQCSSPADTALVLLAVARGRTRGPPPRCGVGSGIAR
jgi:transposase-like protein